MLRPALHHTGRAAAVLVAAALTVLLAIGWRLSLGPIPAVNLKPAVERLIVLQFKGGKAKVDNAAFVWFAKENAVGVEVNGVSLVDHAGRTVLKAKSFSIGWALDGFASGPSLARVKASDFFAAVSVSPRGRYELGYEAEGPPRRIGGLLPLFHDLTNRAHGGRPLSYLRNLELDRGVVVVNQVGGPVHWRGQINRAVLHKIDGRLQLVADVAIDAGGPRTVFKADGLGSIGLRQARLHGVLTNLNPAHIFPSVGPTAALSALDAQVQGRGAVDYASRSGMHAADVDLEAGEGRIRVGQVVEPFHNAQFRAVFDRRSGDIALPAIRVSAARADLNLTGRARLIPEGKGVKRARLDWSVSGDHGALALASRGDAQPFKALFIRGRYTPGAGRIDFDEARAIVDDAPAWARGALLSPPPGKSWGLKLDGAMTGVLRPQQIMALWPDYLASHAREWVAKRRMDGRIGNLTYALDLPIGAHNGQPLGQDMVNVKFAFADALFEIGPDFPLIERGQGSAVLMGDEFDLLMRTAQMRDVVLRDGVLSLPHLKMRDKKASLKVHAAGPARQILEVADGPAPHVATASGLRPAQLDGRGEVLLEMAIPLNDGATGDDYRITYKGLVRDAAVERAALGMNLRSPTLNVDGSKESVRVSGEVRLGPYRGPLDFAAQFGTHKARSSKALLKGVIDTSTLGLSGPAGSVMDFAGRFETKAGAGQGTIHAAGFNGQATWRDGADGRVVVQGMLNAAAWRSIGVPVSKSMPDRTAAKLTLTRNSAGGWSGPLEADVYTGALSFAPGPTPRMRYAAQIDPTEARRLGLGADPAFNRTQPMIIDISGTPTGGAASYEVGPMTGQVNWLTLNDGRTQYHWRAMLSEADLHAFGLPATVHPRGPTPIDISMTSVKGVWNGMVLSSGLSMRFTAPQASGGRRRVSLSGTLDGLALDRLGLMPLGMVSGPSTLTGAVDFGPQGVGGGHLDVDFTQAALSFTAASWRKPAGKPLRMSADLGRRPDGSMEASRLHASGSGVEMDGSASWRPAAGALFQARSLHIEGLMDGSLSYQSDVAGDTLTVRGRYLDARRYVQRTMQDGAPPSHVDRPRKLDLDIGEVRVSDTASLRHVRVSGLWGDSGPRRMDISAITQAGSMLNFRLYPDAGRVAVAGDVGNVADIVYSVWGLNTFRGGTATVRGHLAPGGADLDVEMKNVRLVHAPPLAQILTMGSLKGLADTLNGSGIEFSRVVAPVKVRGSQLIVGEARATGPALGLTTSGVIDLNTHRVDLSGGIAPAYTLNSIMGNVPVLGGLLVSRKGEGVFGLTYSAKGAFAGPHINVNPLSIATPGILRRLFEGKGPPPPPRAPPELSVAAPSPAGE